MFHTVCGMFMFHIYIIICFHYFSLDKYLWLSISLFQSPASDFESLPGRTSWHANLRAGPDGWVAPPPSAISLRWRRHERLSSGSLLVRHCLLCLHFERWRAVRRLAWDPRLGEKLAGHPDLLQDTWPRPNTQHDRKDHSAERWVQEVGNLKLGMGPDPAKSQQRRPEDVCRWRCGTLQHEPGSSCSRRRICQGFGFFEFWSWHIAQVTSK